MKPTPEIIQNNEEEKRKEYFDFVKESAIDGSYFQDAIDWYLFRYVNPLCDRTIMIFVSIVAAISIFFLIQIIQNIFPLVEKVPVVIKAKDESLYTPFIKPLRDHNDISIKNVDEAVARYLILSYVSDRENFDYRKGEIEDVNVKFNRIKNNSSFVEYRNFQSIMDKNNVDSPLNFFGLNNFREINIQSFSFMRNEPQDYYQKMKGFFSAEIPHQAEVNFIATTHNADENGVDKPVTENFLAKITFDFAGVDRDAKSGTLNFSVTNYKLYKVN